MSKVKNTSNDPIKFVFKQLQAAKAAKAEADFQFDVAETNRMSAQRRLWEAEAAFQQASDELFEKQCGNGGEKLQEVA